jgi:hypothetical protein
MKNLKNNLVPKNYVAKDLRTPKYRMRVVDSKVKYDRKSEKTIIQKELVYV